MRARITTAGVSLMLAGALGVGAAGPIREVKVKLTTSKGEDGGTVVFRQAKDGVKMKVSLRNVPFGPHAVHIHQNAVCDAPDFKGAGPHFNPDGKQHGFSNPMGHHNGDTPGSVDVGENHMGEATWTLTGVSLDPAAPNSIFANGGTAVVVHEKADDEKTDPSGASGNRIACAVVKQP